MTTEHIARETYTTEHIARETYTTTHRIQDAPSTSTEPTLAEEIARHSMYDTGCSRREPTLALLGESRHWLY